MTEKEASLLLRRLRKQSGLTQEALGEAAGTTGRTILEAEKADNTQLPHGITILRMLEAMDVLPKEDRSKPGPLARLEEAVAESIALTRETLELLRESRPQAAAGRQARGSGGRP